MRARFGYVDGRWMGVMLISVSEVVGSYLMERNSNCLTLFQPLFNYATREKERVSRDTLLCITFRDSHETMKIPI